MKHTKKIIITAALMAGISSGGYYTYKEFGELKEDNKKLSEQVSNLSDLVVNKDKLIDRYLKENEQLEINNQKLSNQVKVKDGEIEVLNQTIKNKNSSIHNLKQQLEKATKRNESPRTVSRGTSSLIKDGEIYEVTAYHAGYESTGKNKGDKGYSITASGTTVKEGRTIACPPELPFGTKVRIETVGYRVCEDRGGAIKGKILDLYIADRSKVWEFGRKKLKVTILN